MTRQTWTAFVAAVVFVATAALLVAIPVPFITWNPGMAYNTLGSHDGKPMISVDGIQTYPTSGQLDLTTVSVTRQDSRLTLPEALMAYWMPSRDTLPRDADTTAEEAETQERVMMETAQQNAIVAALRAGGESVTEMPVVSSVTVGGAAEGLLEPGDLFVSVDGVPVTQVDQVGALIKRRVVSDPVTFVVLRGSERTTVGVVTQSAKDNPGQPVVGIEVGVGYAYDAKISYDLGERIGGPSAGFVFSLAIYDLITAGELMDGRHVAGTGTIDVNGKVGAIGGIQEKIAGADRAGADTFLVPAANCGDLAGVNTDLNLIKVETLEDGISALETLNTPGGESKVPHC